MSETKETTQYAYASKEGLSCESIMILELSQYKTIDQLTEPDAKKEFRRHLRRTIENKNPLMAFESESIDRYMVVIEGMKGMLHFF